MQEQSSCVSELMKRLRPAFRRPYRLLVVGWASASSKVTESCTTGMVKKMGSRLRELSYWLPLAAMTTSHKRRANLFGHHCTHLCKNIYVKLGESSSKCSAVHPKNALWSNISARHSQNLAAMLLHYSVNVLGCYHTAEQRFLIARRRDVMWAQTFVMISVIFFNTSMVLIWAFGTFVAIVQNCKSDLRPLSFSLLWQIMVPCSSNILKKGNTADNFTYSDTDGDW